MSSEPNPSVSVKLDLQQVPCPHCGSDEARVFALGTELASFADYPDFDGFERSKYVTCVRCELIYASPRIKYHDRSFDMLFPTHVDQRRRQRTWWSKLRRRRHHSKRLRRIVELLGDRRGTFLETGCAFGDVMLLARRMGFEPLGTELFEDYLAACRGRGLDVVRGSIDGLRFDDDQFDVVYSEAVLEHVANPFTFIDDMQRVLKPGGGLFLHTWTVSERGKVEEVFGPGWRQDPNLDLTAHYTLFPTDLLLSYLAAAGLTLEHTRLTWQVNRVLFYDFYLKKAG